MLNYGKERQSHWNNSENIDWVKATLNTTDERIYESEDNIKKVTRPQLIDSKTSALWRQIDSLQQEPKK